MGSNKMAKSYLHFLPAAVFIILPSTFIVTYFWSVKNDHVYPDFPSISETGALPPESCLFGMMVNLTAFTMLFSVYVRHKEVVEVFRVKRMADTNPGAFMVNRVSTITGVVACTSLDVLANFQEANKIGYIHQAASVICFYSSAMYLLQQAVLTKWLVPEVNGTWLVYVRWTLGVLAAVTVISNTMATAVSITLFMMEKNHTTQAFSKTTSHWAPNEPGYTWHCAGAVLEWVTVGTLGTYILTLYWDFKKITIFEPEIEVAEDPVPEPVKPVGFQAHYNDN